MHQTDQNCVHARRCTCLSAIVPVLPEIRIHARSCSLPCMPKTKRSLLALLHSLLLLFLLYAAPETVTAASQEDCQAIAVNIDPIVMPCRVSARQCLEAPTIGSINDIMTLICNPRAKNLRVTLVECRGLTYADQVYGGVCGNIDNSTTSCVNAVLKINDGEAAKARCCTSSAGSGSAENCSYELEQMSRELGCCTATIVPQLFFSDCQTGQLNELLTARGLPVPETCEHVFTGVVGGARLNSGPWLVVVVLAAVFAYSGAVCAY